MAQMPRKICINVDTVYPKGEVPLSTAEFPVTELEHPQDILGLYWARGQEIDVLFGDLVIERYGHSKDKYSLYIVDSDVEEFQGGDIRVIQRLGGLL